MATKIQQTTLSADGIEITKTVEVSMSGNITDTVYRALDRQIATISKAAYPHYTQTAVKHGGVHFGGEDPSEAAQYAAVQVAVWTDIEATLKAVQS